MHGFTLLELLVAITVFAFVSVIAYTGLHTVLQNKERTEEHAARLQQLQNSILLMQRDLLQFAARSIRDEYGERQPALKSADLGDYLLEFSSGGRPNPTGIKRSSLQRIAYGVSDGKLVRYLWPVLDRAQESQPYALDLLDGVTAFDCRYLAADRQWSPQWPPVGGKPDDLPLAVEVTLESETMGRFRRLFPLPLPLQPVQNNNPSGGANP